jgi:2-polyprenyl-3-methyl-5-hydroxy-6-metoxy-1,4-benzoquinol methylase
MSENVTDKFKVSCSIEQVEEFDSRINYGNIRSNIYFLRKTNVLSKKQRILEIGSGVGSLLNHLHKKGYDIIGVDIDRERVEKGKHLYGDIPLYCIKDEILPFKADEFDVVMSFDVLEHIPNTDLHLEQVGRVLKRNGRYLLQTPNKYTNSIFETIRHKSFTKWREGHCSLHSYREIIDRFRSNGFNVEFHDIPVVNDFFKKKMYRYTGSLGLVLLRILNPDKFPMCMRTNFYIEAKNVSGPRK